MPVWRRMMNQGLINPRGPTPRINPWDNVESPGTANNYTTFAEADIRAVFADVLFVNQVIGDLQPIIGWTSLSVNVTSPEVKSTNPWDNIPAAINEVH